jgi:hypothetical protein
MGLLARAARAAPPEPNDTGDQEPDATDPNEATEQGTPTDPTASTGQGDDVDGSGEQPNVTPEEQAAYDAFVKNGMKVIYDGQTARPDILTRLKQHPDDPVGTIANVTVWLVTMLETSAEQSGDKVPDDVLLHGAIALMEELAEVSEAAKIHTYTEQELNAALLKAVDLYREAGTQSGKINPDDLKQEFGQIVDADKAGNVQSVLPGIETAPQGAPAAQPAPDDQQQGG